MSQLIDRFPLKSEGSAILSLLPGRIVVIFMGMTLGLLILLFSWKGLLVASGASVAILILLRPDLGLFIVIANMPVINAFGGAGATVLSSIKVLGLFTFASWLIHLALHKPPLVKTPQNRLIILFIFLTFCSLLFAKDFNFGLMLTVSFFLNFIFYFLILNIVDSQKRLNIVIWVLIFSVAAIAVIGFAQYFLNFKIPTPANIAKYLTNTEAIYWQEKMRVTSTQLEPNTFALILLMIVPPTFFLLIRERKLPKKLFLTIILVILLIVIVFTFSRMAFLGLLVASICIWFKVEAKLKARILIFFLITLLVIGLFHPQYLSRIKSIYKIDTDPAIQARLKVWAAGLPILRDHLFTGVGVGNFATTVDYAPIVHRGLPLEAHNTYLEVATEMGILGFILFIGIIWLTFRDLNNVQAISKYSKNIRMLMLSQALEVSFICYLFCGLFVSLQYFKYFWLIVALAPAMRRIIQEFIVAPEQISPQR